MHEAIVEKLYNEYIANGFISEDKIFVILQKEGAPLFDVEYICDQLLTRGVIILEDNTESEDDGEDDLLQTDYSAVYAEIINLDKGLCNIVEFMKNVSPPQRREWQNLLPQAQNGNQYARNRVFEMYMRVASKIALQFAKRYDLPIADTMQDAFWGLSLAIDKFEYGKQDYFTTYFPFWVRQIIMREAQTKNPIIYFPAHFKEKLFAVYDLVNTHYCEQCVQNGVCSDLINEISNVINGSTEEAMRLYYLLQPVDSLEKLKDQELMNEQNDNYSDDGLFLEEMVDQFECKARRERLNSVLFYLTPRELYVVSKRYGLETGVAMTLEEISQALRITRERVRQIESKAIRILAFYAKKRAESKPDFKRRSNAGLSY